MPDATATEYTPTPEQVRDAFLLGAFTAAHTQGQELDRVEAGMMFDRMLNGIRAAAFAEGCLATAAAIDWQINDIDPMTNPYTGEKIDHG